MTSRPDTEPLPFVERLLLTRETCCMMHDRRGGYLSDDDISDAASMWTTDDLDAFYAAGKRGPDPDDYSLLREAIFDLFWSKGGL